MHMQIPLFRHGCPRSPSLGGHRRLYLQIFSFKKIKRTKLKYHILERYIFTNSWFSFIGIHQNSLFVPHACLHMLGPGGWWRLLSSKLSESSLKKSVLFFFEKYKRKRLNFHGKKRPLRIQNLLLSIYKYTFLRIVRKLCVVWNIKISLGFSNLSNLYLSKLGFM